MNPPADAIESRPIWLSRSLVRVLKLPRELPLREGVERLALQLLRSIEADFLPVPSIHSTSRGAIRITWEHGDRTLMLLVTDPDCLRVGRSVDGRLLPVIAIRDDRVERLRRQVAWLFPGANQGTADHPAGWGEP